MKKRLSKVLVLVVCLSLSTTGVAWAHVVVSPEEVPAGEYEKMVVTVPTEKEIPTTEVRVEVPEGFVVSGVQPVPGWEHEFEEEGGVVTAVVWSGGEIGPREFQEFALQAQTPEEAGEFSWGATQTYEDGSTVEWTGPEDSEEPASVVRVAAAAGSAQEEEHGADEEAVEESGAGTAGNLPDSGGTNPTVYYAGAGCAVLALIVATLSALRRWRT
jgi:uncharacterized protein YcnI